jgi:hypothetical protein
VSVEQWFSTAGKFAAVAGAVLYGVLRLANSFFYSPLGVKPEEVGLSRAEILAQSVTGLLIFLGAFLVLFVVCLGVGILYSTFLGPPIRWIRDRIRRAFGHPPGRDRGASTSGFEDSGWFNAAVGLVVLAAVSSVFLPDSVASPLVATLGLIVAVVIVLVTVQADIRARRDRRWRRAGAVALAIATLLVLATVLLQGWSDGRAVLDGEVRHARFGGVGSMPISSWGADAATVGWIGSGLPPDELADPCFLYLGRGDGLVVLFDPRTRRSLRVPAGDVLVSVDGTAEDGELACAA